MTSAANIKQVLLVDDDLNIRTLAQMGLEGLTDWKVELAASGAEAIDKANEIKPDLIILDVMMPGMDGPTTLGELRKLDALTTIPVIFMTAKAQTHEVELYQKMGAKGIITKPFDPMTLPDDIQGILNKS
ncbi:MAG TPA: response regulator [Candidatus Melainabacteria bacterium]|jgi:two-component system, OmpR family, response regulator|nr:response regulator [Candidatus Melainabacteria bacterium]